MTGGPGAFTHAARAAILAATGGRCAGCGSPGPLELNHRAARRMGGTSLRGLGQPHNGVALCNGPGTNGCHAWSEANPDEARLLGWRLHEPDPAEPFWTVHLGWCRWVLLDDGPPCWCVQPFQTPPSPGRDTAVRAFQRQEES